MTIGRRTVYARAARVPVVAQGGREETGPPPTPGRSRQVTDPGVRVGGDAPKVAAPAAKIPLRVFVHFHGERLILLLGGYDKGDDPTSRRQRREIAVARRRLAQFKTRQRRS